MLGKQAGCLANEIVLNLEFFKIIYQIKYSTFRYVYQRHSVIIVVPIHFSLLFCIKSTLKVDFGHANISDTIFSGQSLLLSTTVLND